MLAIRYFVTATMLDQIAFDILPDDKKLPPGYSKASGHIIFGVQMTLEQKVRWFKDGHKTPQPDWSTYAGVVSRELYV